MYRQIYTKQVIVIAFLISLAYLMLAVFLMNNSLVRDTLMGSYSLEYKVKILSGLLYGITTSMTTIGAIVLISISFLTGLNISLLINRVNILRKSGGIKIAIGGSAVVGIIASGCAACGLPIISLLGFSGLVMLLPYHGFEFQFIVIGLLVISLYFLIKSSIEDIRCEMPSGN